MATGAFPGATAACVAADATDKLAVVVEDDPVTALLAASADDVVVSDAEVVPIAPAVVALVAGPVAREAELVPAPAPAPPHATRPIIAKLPSPATSTARRDRRAPVPTCWPETFAPDLPMASRTGSTAHCSTITWLLSPIDPVLP
ncbi:MAG: hypothetical protein ACHQ7M_21590, partial [Chloroflexota bacterium]